MILSFNNKPAFETVFKDNYQKLYKYVYMLLLNREDTEDIVSETFTAAFSCYADYDSEKGNVLTWLSKIAHNKVINLRLSGNYRNRTSLSDEDIRKILDSKEYTEMEAVNETAEHILLQLSIKEREFLNLRYGLELSDKEIGALLNEKENTIIKRYQRLLKKCRDIVNDNCDHV